MLQAGGVQHRTQRGWGAGLVTAADEQREPAQEDIGGQGVVAGLGPGQLIDRAISESVSQSVSQSAGQSDLSAGRQSAQQLGLVAQGLHECY